MAGTNRKPRPDIIRRLLTKGHCFSFVQAVRLLGRGPARSSGNAAGKSGHFNRIRVRPNLSMTFPAADIEKVAHNRQTDQYGITANFLTLYGTESPLPAFYTEDLIEEEREDRSVTREFIDILNSRIYELLFYGWAKYRSMIQVIECCRDEHTERLYCLTGLGLAPHRKSVSDPFGLLRYTGLFSMLTRSAAGLETLLTDALGHQAAVTPAVRRMAPIPKDQIFLLGVSGNCLNRDGYLGSHIPDRMGAFKVGFGPLTEKDFRRFFPGTHTHARLMELIRLYIRDPLVFHVDLFLRQEDVRTAVLNPKDQRWGSLGLDTWLFSGEKPGTPKITLNTEHRTIHS